MHKNTFYILVLGVLLICASFTEGYKLYKSIPVDHATFFSIDNFGNSYVVTNDILSQYSPSGDLMLTYNERQQGHLTYVDVSNPLKLLLFYPDFARVVVLDNKLSPKGQINFRDVDIFQPGLVCNSYNDAIWVFDQQELKLKRLDASLRKVNESSSLGQVAESIAPNFMLEVNNWLYVNNPSTGIMVFDVYGTYYKTLPFTGLHSFQVVNDQLVYFRYNRENGKPELKTYNLKTIEEKDILLPAPYKADSILDARLTQEKLFLFKKEVIDLYSF